MNNSVALFTAEQGNLIIRLLLAHVLADFVFQTRKMVQSKGWFTGQMWLHISVVFVTTLLLSNFLWILSTAIALLHWVTDGSKAKIRATWGDFTAFVADQAAHILVIVAAWAYQCGVWSPLMHAAGLPLFRYKASLILLAYLVVMFPTGYFIRFATQNITATRQPGPAEAEIRNGGTIIGWFERMIMLTLVLYGHYDAIGFLIAGKSLIRFADRDHKLRSEYVLVGTMMSYGIAILTGVIVNYLLTIK